MRGLLLCAVFLAGQAGDGQPSAAEPAVSAKPRKLSEIEKDVQSSLRRESQAPTRQERAVATHALVDLYQEIQRDSRQATSPTLSHLQVRLKGRLSKVRGDILKDLFRERQSAATARSRLSGASHTVAASGANTSGSASRAAALKNYGSLGGRAGPPDWGQALVELIERTIAPGFWDVNGGPGSIYYYQPQQALVVRATGDVHGQVGTLIGGLRAAGQ